MPTIAEIRAKRLAKPPPPAPTLEEVADSMVATTDSNEIVELRGFLANKRASFGDKIKARKKLNKLLAEQKALATVAKLEDLAQDGIYINPDATAIPSEPVETFSLDIKLNERQELAAEMAEAGNSFVLTGAAGTGKTTAVREIARKLLNSNKLRTHDFKANDGLENFRWVGPSIAIVAYTRIATNNIRNALHKDPELEKALEYNVCTIHRLLEYEPVSFVNDAGKDSVKFEPKRTATNPLTLSHLVIEEASMLDTILGSERLLSALPSDCQIIYLGDINQLQPVMGKSVLQYGLVKLPVVELTHVYRQALDSDIIKIAHAILRGKVNEFFDIVDNSAKQQVKIVARKQSFTEEKLVYGLGQSFEKLYNAGSYDPDQDIILSPFNKNALGTDNLNKWIAQFLGADREATVHEVLTGRVKLYLAEGDRVMVDKRYGIITKIKANPRYVGTIYKGASKNLSRFGMYIMGQKEATTVDEDEMFVGYENLNIDEEPTEEKKREASHMVTVEFDDGMTETFSKVGNFAPASFSLGYALTVHKAQGCEWRKVYLVLHNNHAVLLSRELFYTACTRAKEKLEIIANESTIRRTISNARLKGDSLAEKIEYFNSGSLDTTTVAVTSKEYQERRMG